MDSRRTTDRYKGTAHKGAAYPRRVRRWLLRIIIVLAILIGIPVNIYLFLRFVYPVWIQLRVPRDAPRIAFSLDNSLWGRVGITDATYQRAMTAAGGRLVVLRPDAAGTPVTMEAVKALLDEKRINGVLLAGGGDVDPNVYGGEPGATMLVHRQRDDFEIALIRAARQKGLPVLGICRGCQILNVALGGTVRNLRKEPAVKKLHLTLKGHPVDLTADSELARTLGVTHLEKVVSLHGQAAGEPGPQVTVAATGPGGVVEAIEADSAGKRGWIVGIQWHPELTLDRRVQQQVFRALVERAGKMREHRLAAHSEEPVAR